MNRLRKMILSSLISLISYIFRERTLALAKFLLPLLPYGKAIAVATILIRKYPTNDATRKFYDSARPRWKRGFVFRVNPACPLSKLFALTGLYQPEMTEELLKESYQGAFVDIGANFGYFSVLWLSKRHGDTLAIEPIRQNYELLTTNIRQFGSRAKTLMQCLGERRGEVTMRYDPNYPMLSHLSDESTQDQKVEMETLRDVLEKEGLSRIDVLKCDAEGYDVKILRSAHEIFEERRVRVLFFEPETWDRGRDPELEAFNQLLLANGYRLIPNKGDLCYSLRHL
jgi:FkbM family methyltransferase